MKPNELVLLKMEIRKIDTVRQFFAFNLRRMRSEAELTQERLAELSDLSIAAIQNLEHGKSWPESETILTLSKALNVDYRAFFKSVEAATRKPTPREAIWVIVDALGLSEGPKSPRSEIAGLISTVDDTQARVFLEMIRAGIAARAAEIPTVDKPSPVKNRQKGPKVV